MKSTVAINLEQAFRKAHIGIVLLCGLIGVAG